MSDPRANNAPVPSNASRRTVLKTTGLVALVGGGAAGLAACSADADTATPPAPSAQGSSPSAPAASTSASGAESSAPSSEESSNAPAPTGTTVAKSEVTEGGGVVVQDKYVVTQPSAGEFKAFSAICTHQGCPVSQIQNAEIICQCHGSHFSITDGSPTEGPAQTPLPAVQFTESGDDIVIAD